MTESHVIEYKESWRDEYLRWVCGFANAESGTLIIGRNDAGQAVGVADAHCTTALIQSTIPDKPTSRLQKYRLTAAGRAALQSHRRTPTSKP